MLKYDTQNDFWEFMKTLSEKCSVKSNTHRLGNVTVFN